MQKIIPTLLLFLLVMPALMAQSKVNNPEKNFEFLWNLFNENYASFEEKNINWQETYNTYRPQVTTTTTDEELFEVCTNMLKPLQDSHVKLKAKNIDKYFAAQKSSKIIKELNPVDDILQSVTLMTDSTLLKQGFLPMQTLGSNFMDQPLFSYTQNPVTKVAYLRIYRCFSHLFFKKGLSLKSQLNKVFQSFENAESLIIDIRFNIGGTDSFSKLVAGYLTDKKVLGYYKQTRQKNQTFSEKIPHYIFPKGKHKFLNKVYLITNNKSVSAADVMALMLQQLPKVTIVGDNSNGSFSDIYSKKMPNGWQVMLSNQRYLSPKMINYEGKGVPVNIKADTSLKDVQTKHDTVLIKTIESNTK